MVDLAKCEWHFMKFNKIMFVTVEHVWNFQIEKKLLRYLINKFIGHSSIVRKSSVQWAWNSISIQHLERLRQETRIKYNNSNKKKHQALASATEQKIEPNFYTINAIAWIAHRRWISSFHAQKCAVIQQ